MSKPQLFQFAVIWHPTEKQIKDDGLKSKVIVEPKTILAADEGAVKMHAAMSIDQQYRDQLDQIDIAVAPF